MLTGILISACGSASSNRALGVDADGNLALYPPNIPGPDNVTWYLGQGFNADGAPLGAFLRNKGTGGYLYGYYRDGYLTPSLAVGPKETLDEWSTWTFGELVRYGYVAVRPYADSRWNVNILGGCGGTEIGLYGWSGGDANEIWSFTVDPTARPTPDYFSILSRCGGNLSADPATGRVFFENSQRPSEGRALDPTTWKVEIAMGSVRGGVPFPLGGFALINSVTGFAIGADRDDAPVVKVGAGSLTKSSAWTAGGDDGSAYVAVRAVSDDDLNLNVDGGCVGLADVITYGWQGGRQNETWKFVRLSAGAVEQMPGDIAPDEPSKPEVW